MTQEEMKEGIRALVAEATGDALGVEVDGRDHEGTMQMNVRFTRPPEMFNFLPLMARLEPISENAFSDRFGEKCWIIGGRFGGHKVSVSFRVQFVREMD